MNLPRPIDDFDWSLGRGRTPSVQTGPTFDRSLGNGGECQLAIMTSASDHDAFKEMRYS